MFFFLWMIFLSPESIKSFISKIKCFHQFHQIKEIYKKETFKMSIKKDCFIPTYTIDFQSYDFCFFFFQ